MAPYKHKPLEPHDPTRRHLTREEKDAGTDASMAAAAAWRERHFGKGSVILCTTRERAPEESR